MIKYIFAFTLGLVLIFLFSFFKTNHQVGFTPQSAILDPSPPQVALSGNIISVLNTVTKLSRDNTDYQPLKISDKFLQGETIKTDKFAQTSISFPEFLNLDIFPISTLSLVNANPLNFLVNQSGGSVSFTNSQPISNRILHLLIQLNSGKSQISIDAQKIRIKLISGTASIAYNDLTNTTHVVNFSAPKIILFNDSTRTYTTPRR